MTHKRTALLCVGILLATSQVLSVRNENSRSNANGVDAAASKVKNSSTCNVALLAEDYPQEEMHMLEDNQCKCYHDDPYAWHDVTSAEDCLGTEKRKLVCRWDDGCKSVSEECDALDWASDPQGCHNFEPLGCISDDPRPLALGGNNTSEVHLLSNDENEICYFNSAIVNLFAGANDLVPHLQSNAGGECFRSIRRSLTHIVRAMRNEPTVREEAYLRKMTKCIRANCAEEDNDDNKMLYLARKDNPSGEALGVLTGIFLPAMGLTWHIHSLEYADCDTAPGLISCLHMLRAHQHVAGEDLQIFVFNQRKGATFSKDFQLFEAGGQLHMQGVNYTMWSGTAATRGHVKSWTVHPQVAPRLTVYDDQPPVGIREFPDVEAGFADLGRWGEDLRIQMIVFKQVRA